MIHGISIYEILTLTTIIFFIGVALGLIIAVLGYKAKSLTLDGAFTGFFIGLFIFGLGSFEGMGVQGAAVATTIGRSIGVMYQIYMLSNGKAILRIARKNRRGGHGKRLPCQTCDVKTTDRH